MVRRNSVNKKVGIMMNTKEYKDFILERMDLPILAKSMMGGYLFYYENTLFGGIYTNDNFLIKKTKSNQDYGLEEEIPYQGGKPMYLIVDFEDVDLLREIIINTCHDLKK